MQGHAHNLSESSGPDTTQMTTEEAAAKEVRTAPRRWTQAMSNIPNAGARQSVPAAVHGKAIEETNSVQLLIRMIQARVQAAIQYLQAQQSPHTTPAEAVVLPSATDGQEPSLTQIGHHLQPRLPHAKALAALRRPIPKRRDPGRSVLRSNQRASKQQQHPQMERGGMPAAPAGVHCGGKNTA